MDPDTPHPPIFSIIPEDLNPPRRNRAKKKDGGKRIDPFSRRDLSVRQQYPSSDAIMQDLEDHSSRDRHKNSSFPSGTTPAPTPYSEDRRQNNSKPVDTALVPYVELESVSQPVESTVSLCVYTVQAVHGILTSAARAGNYDQVAAMRTKYWRKNLRTDQTITIAAEDASFFECWNKHRETTAQKQHEQAWMKDYERLHSDTSRDMPLEKFATLAAVSAVVHTKHEPIPSTLPSATADLLDFRTDVDHIAPPTSDQDNRSSTNVVGQTTAEDRSKRTKNHADSNITIVCHDQPPFVQPVFQLLAEPLYALLGTDKYKAFLQRSVSFRLLGRNFVNVRRRQLVDFPAYVSSLLQRKTSPEVDLSWLCDPEEEHPVPLFARKTLVALKESLRPHPLEPEDEMDCHHAFREPGLSSLYRRSPIDRLFASTFTLDYECCGNAVHETYSGDLLHFSYTGTIHPPLRPTCRTCSLEPLTTWELKQAPAFVLVDANPNRATFTRPPPFSYRLFMQHVTVSFSPPPTYTCCGFIIQEPDNSFTTFVLSGRDWHRYQDGHVTFLGQNVDAHLTPNLIMYRRD
ncbi:hypothetical protein KCU65_g5164, partial [Aureobasidium melanogenum]